MLRPTTRALYTATIMLFAGTPTIVAAAPAEAAAGRAATVRVSGELTVRTAPSTSARAVGALRDRTRIRISCAVTGQRIHGTVRTTRTWDRLTSGRYVSHAYVRTASKIPACAPATPPTAPTMTNAQFIASAVAGAQRGWRDYRVPASVTIAQAILESGWGRSTLAANDRNYFGIKCFGGPGPIAKGCHTYRTFECGKGGSCFPAEASFRTYAVPADSFRDHGHFLRHNSRYKPAFSHSRDADEFVRQIRKAGYATDPEYVAKVTGLMKSYNLYRYDVR